MRSVIYHPDWIFEENLNLVTKIENSVYSTCYCYICPIVTLQENLTLADGWWGILLLTISRHCLAYTCVLLKAEKLQGCN